MRIVMCILILFFSWSCHQREDKSSCEDSIGVYTFANYPIGTAINFEKLYTDSLYTEIGTKQFNSITAENIFKAEYLHPKETEFNWVQADSLVNFCTENNKRIHGHTLIWDEQLPTWIPEFKGDSADWQELMKNHIQTIVHHFKEKVKGWDVVNEAFNEDGSLKKTGWLIKIGDDYMEKAFNYTHAADTSALLFYNDYKLESNPVKRKSVITYLNKLRNKGVKIDGIGLQMHISTSKPTVSEIASAINEIVQNGYLVHLSELDISINPEGKEIELAKELFVKQAELLGAIVSAYNHVPNKYQYGITFFGICDKYTWIRSYLKRQDYPLLYDDNYLPKPAYCTLKEALKSK